MRPVTVDAEIAIILTALAFCSLIIAHSYAPISTSPASFGAPSPMASSVKTITSLSAPVNASVGSSITLMTTTVLEINGSQVAGGQIIISNELNGSWSPLPGCQGFVYNGTFACTWTPYNVGGFSLKADYLGYIDAQTQVTYEDSSSQVVQVEVGPIETSISLTAFPEQASFDPQTLTASVQISGQIVTTTGPPVSGGQVVLSYVSSSGEYIKNLMTDSSGHFVDQFVAKNVSSGLNSDVYSVVASWAGDSNHKGATSEPAVFYVAKITTKIQISIATVTVTRDLLMGASEVRVSGNLVPGAGSALVSIDVVGPMSINQTVQTQPDGSFSWSFVPKHDGTYTVVATYVGDGAHSSALSSSTHVEVSPGYSTVGLVAVVGIVAAAFSAWRLGYLKRLRRVEEPKLEAMLEARYGQRGLKCPKCSFVNRPGATFCTRDRTPLTLSVTSQACPSCGKANRSTASFCKHCRARLR